MTVDEKLSPFESKIAALVAELTCPATSAQIMALLGALGCHLIYHRFHYWMDAPDQPPTEAEALVRTTLAIALHAHLDSHSEQYDELMLMEGLLRHDRWRDLLETPGETYAFAELILSLCDGPPNAERLREKVEDGMYAVFSTWLGANFDAYPTSAELASAMFGIAWVDMVIPFYTANSNLPEYYPILAAMKATHPTFLPGLVTWQKAVELPLPVVA